MKQITAIGMYNAVWRYCDSTGLVRVLKNSFKSSESSRFAKLRISRDGLHLVDAVHCVYDKRRTLYFLNELDRVVTRKSVVLEAGIGTGILTFFAATRAKHVYGYEINKSILRFAQEVGSYLTHRMIMNNKPTLTLRDATRGTVPEKVDVILSENIYSGMFFEKQVQIMNRLRKYLKRGGVMIPQGLFSYVALAETQLPVRSKHLDLFVPSPERHVNFKRCELSRPQLYSRINFSRRIDRGVDVDLRVPVSRGGLFNSVVIYSEVHMPSGKIIKRDDTTFLNSDIILAFQPAVRVSKGETVCLRLKYQYGAKPGAALLKAAIIPK